MGRTTAPRLEGFATGGGDDYFLGSGFTVNCCV
jgi:hypothetical protein